MACRDSPEPARRPYPTTVDALFFRSLCRELGPRLAGHRLDKVHSPLEHVWSFALSTRGGGFLFLQSGPAGGFLCLVPNRPANPLTPPAKAMWFRKRLSGRRIVALHLNWPERIAALELTPGREPGSGRHLLLDLRSGPSLADELPPGFGDEPAWPDLSRVLSDPEVWREFPHISPPLRRTLKALPGPEAETLYRRLRSGEAGGYYLYSGPQGPEDLLAWQLPEEARRGREERVFDTALAAAEAFGEASLFRRAGAAETREEDDAAKAERRRLKKALARVDEDLRRLEGLAAEGIRAEALQVGLSRLKHGPLPARIRLDHPEHGPQDIDLDPRLDAVGNMERLFRLAAKARRGLPVVRQRREDLLARLADLDAGVVPPPPPPGPSRPAAPAPEQTLPQRYRNIPVHVYRLSGGFLAIRGRNSKANHDLLSRAASPFDLWFHVAGGPGAHLILKRDFPAQEVPPEALAEAAALAALSSYRAQDSRAEVLKALVKDVRKVKGLPHGQVHVDAAETLLVTLDPSLEAKLRQP